MTIQNDATFYSPDLKSQSIYGEVSKLQSSDVLSKTSSETEVSKTRDCIKHSVKSYESDLHVTPLSMIRHSSDEAMNSVIEVLSTQYKLPAVPFHVVIPSETSIESEDAVSSIKYEQPAFHPTKFSHLTKLKNLKFVRRRFNANNLLLHLTKLNNFKL